MQVDFYWTLVCATLVLLLGRWLVSRIGFLNTYSIPEPVAGGLVIAVLMTVIHSAFAVDVQFDTGLQNPMMLLFFAAIGLDANLASIRSGGRELLRFLLVVLGLLILQDALGTVLAKLFGIDPLLGLVGASITLSGGHGTGAAWSKVFAERYGLQNALEIAVACATFGLVMGGLIGGPIARFLIARTPSYTGTAGAATAAQTATTATSAAATASVANADSAAASEETFEHPRHEQQVTPIKFIETLAMFAVALSVGSALSGLMRGTAFELPSFVCVLFVGVLLSNGLRLAGYRTHKQSVSLLGNTSLSLFLAMALMTLKLWNLASLVLPVFMILIFQTLAMAAYAVFVTYRVMGKNYDAAVLAAGHCGFGLGATPTAIANMQAITSRFGPSHVAFLIVPMVGAFFIDIANAIVIKLFLLLPLFH